ncbi:PEP-CTERM sorting domain-containing protein [Pseudocolwellia sp. AS88]|uniref:PEP-CTERM sorting domain-containing protein n=1 Tax=Pseudocolwellia sp. AS88 TaxID=3063958 RepID=UPI0026EDD5EF|nr:PEP-CTERM sorting domain-containing protein [Pseudocolwellia sp. AS88]MDO7086578.1 PEP-CTERM sorting domain-containing protein [Pseudocolwellia sp. AS88]
MLNTYFKNALLAISLSLFTIGSANANLIIQDILFDDATTTEVLFETIGSITVDTQDSDGFGTINTWVDFELFGFDMITEADAAGNFALFGLFEVFVDLNNISAGIEFLTFDVTESNFLFYNFQGLVDTAFGGNFFIDVFDFGGGLYVFGDLALGQASVVSEPSMFLLFFTGLFFLVAKRRKN